MHSIGFVTWHTFCAAWLILLVSIVSGNGRPLIRKITNDNEFKRLIKYHHEFTGLGVVVDYFSDSWFVIFIIDSF